MNKNEVFREKKFENLKKTSKIILIFSLLISLFFLGFLTGAKNVNAGANDIDYEFENDYLYDGALPGGESTFNTRNMTALTGHFNATYSFENEIGLENNSISFVENWENYPDTLAKIINILENHRNVLNFTDKNPSVNPLLLNGFDERAIGCVDLWIYLSNTDTFYLYIADGDYTNSIRIQFTNNLIRYHNNIEFITITTYDVNEWIHLSIDFDVNTNWNIAINGVLFDGFEFYGTPILMDLFRCVVASNDMNIYFDAIGYSWDSNYNIGDNMYPYMENERIGYIPTNYTIYPNDAEIYDYGELVSGDLDDLWEIDGESMNFTNLNSEGDEIGVIFDFSNYTGRHAYLDVYATHNSTRGLFDWKIATSSNYNPQNDYENIILEQNTNDPLNVSEFYFEMNNYLQLWCNDDGYFVNVSLDQFRIYTLPFNRTEVDKFEFAYNSTNDRITKIEHVENWVNTTNSDDLSVVSRGIDNALLLTPSATGTNNTLELDFNYFDGNYTEITASVGLDNLTTCRLYYSFYDENDDVKFTFMLSLTAININDDLWDVGYTAYYSYTSDDYINHWDEFTQITEVYYSINYYDGNGFDLMPNEINFTLFNKMIEVDYNNTNLRFLATGDDYSKIMLNAYIQSYDALHVPAVEIDYIGIIVDGVSISNEGIVSEEYHALGVEEWNLLEFNFVRIEVNSALENDIQILVNEELILAGYGELVVDADLWQNKYSSQTFLAPYLTIENNSKYEIENIAIYGIKLVHDAIEVFPTYSNEDDLNTDLNRTYFYVSNNRLYYRVDANEMLDEDLILNFDIPNLHDGDYALEFTSNSMENVKASLILDYISSLDYVFDFSLDGEEIAFELASGRYIRQIQIQLTREDNDYITSSGYITDLTFIYIPDLEFSFTITALVNILIPLLILILVPFGFSIKLGRGVIIPIMVLMAFILAITNLIPAYLFFLIFAGAIVYYVIQKRRGD